nr:MAG TPA: hypothetical protein [Caudoviricetes sp.]
MPYNFLQHYYIICNKYQLYCLYKYDILVS